VVARLAERYAIPWVRRTLPSEMRIPLFSRWTNHVLRRHHCRTADRFLGFRETGRLDAAMLAAIIRELPEGITEFMCHPGYCRDELQAADTRLKESRQRELEALCSPDVKSAIRESGVIMRSYATVSS
jgi:predicted glycoside hydrolase/deacetylase ChbG (UPF0249 family)